MKKIMLSDIDDIERRPELAQWLATKGNVAMWLWSDVPTTEAANNYTKKNLMLAVTTATNKYMVLDKAGNGKDKADRLLVYMTDDIGKFVGEVLPQANENQYIIIPKEKVGRKKTILTEKQQQQIEEWRKGKRGERLSINAIAAKLKVNNRVVMEFVRTLES